MNFQNLEYFVTAANEKSITKAAKILNISQQALSGSINRLEKEFGCTFFERKPKLELTYSGKIFLKTARQMLDMKKQNAALLGDITGNDKGELKIGISHTRGQAILPMLLPEFVKRYPNVDLTIIEDSTEALEKDLENGIIDVLIGYLPTMSQSAEMRPLLKDKMLLAIPKKILLEYFGSEAENICSRYVNDSDISIFKDMPFILLREGERIRTIVNRQFNEKNLTPYVKIETHNVQTAFSLSQEGMGCCIIPEMYVKSKYTIPGCYQDETNLNVVFLPFSEAESADIIGIGYNKYKYLSKFARDFIDISMKKCALEF